MPIIQRPDLVAKVRQTYDLLGPDAISTISPEMVAVVLVDDLTREKPVGKRAHGGYGFSANPVNVGMVGVRNPQGSGVDLYVEQVSMWSAAGTTLTLAEDYLPNQTSSQYAWKDQNELGEPTGILCYQDVAAAGNVRAQVPVVALTAYYIRNANITITENNSIFVYGAAGTRTYAYFEWVEVPRET